MFLSSYHRGASSFNYMDNISNELDKGLKMLQDGYSIITIGSNKRPNFAWSRCQNIALHIIELIDSLTASYKDSITDQGFLPGFAKEGTKTIKNKYKGEDERVFSADGEEVHRIPFYYSSFINQRPTFPIRKQLKDETKAEYELSIILDAKHKGFGIFTSIDEIKDKNHELKKDNIDAHNEAVETNLRVSIPKFIESATKYEAGREVEADLKFSDPFVVY
jgi:hypothetical protein